MIMQLVRGAHDPVAEVLQVRLRPQAAMASEPSTPKAAHSVAVAQPATSTQTMNTISSAQGSGCPRAGSSR